ncbi:MFS transporter [Aquisalimonas lutea]|uniref:MFS transporter n=1 Tax=Aquisalimonas lutea TaxID=1327750 RepID=UPI0025B4691C|nr:MFS transporter [Aquisalimonas lutea]MDN3518013.1 MFS transporter [Aquisalimonas lutea]
MRQFLISITALLASMALLLIGGGLMGTVVSVRLSFDAVDPQIKGLILAAYYIGLVAGSQQAGRIIRHAGHIRAFAIFAAVSTAAILLQGMYVLPAAWFVARVVIGFSTAGIYMVVESWLNERSDTDNRGRVFSVYQIISYVALGAGQFLMHLGDPAGAELFMVVAVLFALCLVPVALSRASNPPEPTPHTPMALRQTVTGAPLAAWTCLASGLISGAIFTLTPAFGVRLGLDVGAIATLMASLILGGVALQWPIGHLSDRYGRRPVILAVGFIAAVLAAGIGFAGARMPFEALLVSVAVLGGFSFTFYPLAVSQANDTIARASDFVAVAGALLFIWGIGAAAGPIAAGWVINRTGDPGLFVYIGAVALATGAVAWIMRWESALARNPYRTLSRTTAVITELDPRAREDAAEPSATQPGQPAADNGEDITPPAAGRP